MRIAIDANPLGPLRILRALPTERLATLEGFNGIGKSLALRLLQLCAGTLPYRVPHPAWSSLRAGLGDFRVRITELSGADEILWEADSREWPEQPTIVDDRFFRTLRINGEPASLDAVRALLSVHRIAGDEGIVETLAQVPDAAAASVSRWRSRVFDDLGVVSACDALADQAHVMIQRVDSQAFSDQKQELAAVRRREREWRLEHDRRRSRLQSMQEAAQIQRQLEELLRDAPDLDARISGVDGDLAAVQDEKGRTEQRVRELISQTASSGEVARELANARRTLNNNRGHLQQSTTVLSYALALVTLPNDLLAVTRAIDEYREKIRSLREEQARLDPAPAMRTLLDKWSAQMAESESSGLGDEVAMEFPDIGLDLSVRQARMGMVARRLTLEGQSAPPEAESIATDIAQAEGYLDRLQNLKPLFDSVERYRRLVATNELRVTLAVEKTNPSGVQELLELEQRRQDLDEEILRLAAERATLRRQRGSLGSGDTEVSLGERLRELVDELSVREEDLSTAAADAEQAWRDALGEFERTRREAAALTAWIREEEQELRRVIVGLSDDSEFAWLREALPGAIPSVNDTPDQQLDLLDRLDAVVRKGTSRLDAFRAQVLALEEAPRGIARHLRGELMGAKEYVPELLVWFGERFSAWFASAPVREELLPGAEEVHVDVMSREVTWRQGEEPRARPLAAFSSGEQAFAYTRARLAMLDDEEQRRPANRLIALDEFGAFLAHDRLNELVRYLQLRVAENSGDQVLVILPLSSDYAALAAATSGEERKRLEGLAEAVSTQLYVSQALM